MIDLPKVPIEDRSVGREFVAPGGSTYRPSTALDTLFSGPDDDPRPGLFAVS